MTAMFPGEPPGPLRHGRQGEQNQWEQREQRDQRGDLGERDLRGQRNPRGEREQWDQRDQPHGRGHPGAHGATAASGEVDEPAGRDTGDRARGAGDRDAGDRLTHIDESGAARMVDVSGKNITARSASASGRVLVSPRVVELLRGGGLPKGDALATARIAGIMGAKRTPDLIPLCHPLAVSGVTVDLTVADDAVEVHATVKTTDRTGVEMEALTAVSVAALTVIDMVKAVDKTAVITDVRVEEKTGGRSGHWSRPGAGSAGTAAGAPPETRTVAGRPPRSGSSEQPPTAEETAR